MKTFLIPKPTLFSFPECLWFLNRNYDDCLHYISKSSITKSIIIGEKALIITITTTKLHIVIVVENRDINKEEGIKLIAYVSEWFDLKRDIRPFYKLLKQNNKLGYMTSEFTGLRLVKIPDVFEALCWSIIGQQINLTFAFKLKRAIVEKYGTCEGVNGFRYYNFPKPYILSRVTIDDLKALQFSRQKADYIISISEAFVNGHLSKAQLLELNVKEKTEMLIAFRGIGIWTANYVLMKSLGDINVIPYGDIGLLASLENHDLISNRKDIINMGKMFQQFKGWESYLVHYLWRSLAVRKIL